jgi:hypothetical protein
LLKSPDKRFKLTSRQIETLCNGIQSHRGGGGIVVVVVGAAKNVLVMTSCQEELMVVKGKE